MSGRAGRTQKTYLSVAASSNSAVVVTAVSGARVALYAFFASAADTATDFFLNDGATTVATKLRATSSSGVPINFDHNDACWVETTDGNALTITTGAGSAVRILAEWQHIGHGPNYP